MIRLQRCSFRFAIRVAGTASHFTTTSLYMYSTIGATPAINGVNASSSAFKFQLRRPDSRAPTFASPDFFLFIPLPPTPPPSCRTSPGACRKTHPAARPLVPRRIPLPNAASPMHSPAWHPTHLPSPTNRHPASQTPSSPCPCQTRRRPRPGQHLRAPAFVLRARVFGSS